MIEEKVCMLPGGYELPLRLSVERYLNVQTNVVQTDALWVQSLLCNAAEDAMLDSMVAGTIVSSRQTFTQEDNCWRLDTVAHCTEMIARSAELKIIEQEDIFDGSYDKCGEN